MPQTSVSPALPPTMPTQPSDGVAAIAIVNPKTTHEAAGAGEDKSDKRAQQDGSHPNTERTHPRVTSYRTYEEKYPLDNREEELGEIARVWRIYADEAQEIDRDVIQEYKESIDVLLVFAGLFSAVLTAFIIQAFQSAQTDYAQVSALFLSVIIREQFNNSALLPTLPSHESLALSSTDHLYIVNRLWYSSLLISLGTALLGILAKQWLVAFRLPSKARSPKQWALWRQFRANGFETWQVPLIISLLPFLLHLSLLLFVIGLVLFLRPFDVGSHNITLGFFSVTMGIYLLATFLPVVFPACPYKTRLFEFIRHYINNIMRLSLKSARHFVTKRFPEFQSLHELILNHPSPPRTNMRFRAIWFIVDILGSFLLDEQTPDSPNLNIHDLELKKVDMQADALTSHALRWLAISSPLEEVFTAVVHSVGAAVPGTRLTQELITRAMDKILIQDLTQRHPLWRSPESRIDTSLDVSLVGAYLRALVNTTAPYYDFRRGAQMISIFDHMQTTDPATSWKNSLGGILLPHPVARGAINDDTMTALLARQDIRYPSALHSMRELDADWTITRCRHLFYIINRAPSTQHDDPFSENTTSAALLVAEVVHKYRNQIDKLVPYTLEIIGALRSIYRQGFPDSPKWPRTRLLVQLRSQSLENPDVCYLTDIWSWLVTKLDPDYEEYNPTLLSNSTIISLVKFMDTRPNHIRPFNYLQNLLISPRVRAACGWDPLETPMYLRVALRGTIPSHEVFHTMIHALLMPWQGDEPTLPALLEYIYYHTPHPAIERPQQIYAAPHPEDMKILRAIILLQSLLQTLSDPCIRLICPIILVPLSFVREPSLGERVYQVSELGEDRATREDLLALLQYAKELLPVLTEIPRSNASGESIGSHRRSDI